MPWLYYNWTTCNCSVSANKHVPAEVRRTPFEKYAGVSEEILLLRPTPACEVFSTLAEVESLHAYPYFSILEPSINEAERGEKFQERIRRGLKVLQKKASWVMQTCSYRVYRSSFYYIHRCCTEAMISGTRSIAVAPRGYGADYGVPAERGAHGPVLAFSVTLSFWALRCMFNFGGRCIATCKLRMKTACATAAPATS